MHTCIYSICIRPLIIIVLLRFYNRLPEVRHRKLEEKRRATYALNRQKAKVYQEVNIVYEYCAMLCLQVLIYNYNVYTESES